MKRTVERALITVSDKTGIGEFAAKLVTLGVEIISTGGTAKVLREAGVAVREVQEITQFPEMMGGRVKTLHPIIHGGILARRDHPEDREALDEHSIPCIDLVVANLYPFEETVAQGATPEQSIEEIDIGGPTLIRAAAKNYAHVAVVVNPGRYTAILDELEQEGTCLSAETRESLALEAFRRTAAYEAAISNWWATRLEGHWPAVRTEQWRKMGDLRYGENPHQKAAWYQREDGNQFSLPMASVRGAKALSYNNLLDVAAAVECVADLKGPAAVIVK
ncbi:MAG: bifunctional phosphoribosylaminoimidazolecarboxamide formyltransferase/IMP cyclohydrolase, partial [Planctomycetota bacterium]